MMYYKLKGVTGYVWGNSHVLSVSEYSVNWMKSSIRSLTITVLCAASATGASNPLLEKQFTQTVEPFVTKYCVGCHSGKTPAAALDLKSFNSMDAVVQDYPRWATVHDRLGGEGGAPKTGPRPPR